MEIKQAELELSTIKKIMEDSRQVVIDNGIHYIFWGVLVTAALLINYAMIIMKVEHSYMGIMWLVLMLSGVVVDIILGKRESKTRKARTFAGKILGSLWFSSAITMFIFGFIGTMSGAYNAVFVCPVISAVLGIAYYTSGSIQQAKMLKYVSFAWWAGAVILFAFPSRHTLLAFAMMLIVLQVVPGVVIYRNSKKDLHYGVS